MFFLSVSYFILRSGYESNPSPPLISCSHPHPPFVSCSESVLELSIMPKDEDVLQLVSANMQTHASDSRDTLYFIMPERHRILLAVLVYDDSRGHYGRM